MNVPYICSSQTATAVAVVLALTSPGTAAAASTQVVIETDEADAVLAILDARQASVPVSDDHWRRLLDSEGYRRLKAREASMGRAFEDADRERWDRDVAEFDRDLRRVERFFLDVLDGDCARTVLTSRDKMNLSGGCTSAIQKER